MDRRPAPTAPRSHRAPQRPRQIQAHAHFGRQREEQTAFAHLAAVERQIGDARFARGIFAMPSSNHMSAALMVVVRLDQSRRRNVLQIVG